MKSLDIIIPVLNEAEFLGTYAKYYLSLKDKSNLIFVDGGSSDGTCEVAKNYGKVVHSSQGRSIQKNKGAEFAESENLLFLHVDTLINPEDVENIVKSLNEGSVCGCLSMQIHDSKSVFRVYERIVNWRAKYMGVLDGDLGMFIKRDVFNKLGQFDLLPVMEDIVFSKKIKQIAKPKILPVLVKVSSRKWKEKGFFYTFGLYTLAYIQLWTNIPFFKFKGEQLIKKKEWQDEVSFAYVEKDFKT